MAASDAFYNGIIAKIAPVFTKLGTTYNVRSPAQFNEDTLSKTPGNTRSVTGVVADQQTALELGALAGASVEWVATKTLILTADAKPQPKEEVQVDGKWYSLDKLMPVKPADVTVVYMLDISK
ncbi:hypothetical protein [Vibrio phage vB_VpaS_CHI]|nr:hypothetical protein [Vibrio phage vB_VpaS_ALK]USL90130.1 hypothetical protein [Vibrio phage vB_VpaS_CHI]